MKWINIEDEYPPSGRRVLFRQKVNERRQITCVGFWIEHLGYACDHEAPEWCFYNEEDDTFYYPTGWYEWIENWDEYSFITLMSGEVTHWMSLPEPPES